ncbi:uncharacterized protein LOC142586868 isoform X4 [Dermacentor variabilis]|uniref:uncharacterized protein LOC142586868 isoform X4 n=1 Tax=Dermacentor variabilis TaxID=34621 RepID=UPI003F5B8991
MREAYKPCLSAGDLRRRSGPIACGWQDDGCPSRKHSRCLANAWNRSLSRMDVLKRILAKHLPSNIKIRLV